CEEEEAERLQLEAELKDLELLWAELQERHLIDLNQEVKEKEAELRQLQTEHDQFLQFVQAQTPQVSVQIQSPASKPRLSVQLQNVSWSGVTLLPPVAWSLTLQQHTQTEACFPPEASELLQLKLTESSLNRELTQLQQEVSIEW
ncbi:hypothetical protein WMY93_034087, partial [Mugilogobius chulae]